MPGTILDIKVKPGDQVSRGDVLLILEAMKMENEIVCPRDAKSYPSKLLLVHQSMLGMY